MCWSSYTDKPWLGTLGGAEFISVLGSDDGSHVNAISFSQARGSVRSVAPCSPDRKTVCALLHEEGWSSRCSLIVSTLHEELTIFLFSPRAVCCSTVRPPGSPGGPAKCQHCLCLCCASPRFLEPLLPSRTHSACESNKQCLFSCWQRCQKLIFWHLLPSTASNTCTVFSKFGLTLDCFNIHNFTVTGPCIILLSPHRL